MRSCFLVAVASFAFAASIGAAEPERIPVFAAGTNGYKSYRIPSVIVTNQGTVLAFAEGRVKGAGDSGDIDLVLKRSTDGGRTFGQQQIVWDDAGNTCGNPCPVVDEKTGTIWLLMTQNLGVDNEAAITKRTGSGTRTVWVSKSTDDGVTWAKPQEITATTKRPEWTWYATGPGAGIQMRNGRLVIPCDHRNEEEFSHVIYSDDQGASWKLGGVADPGGNECEVVELKDGALLLNMRNYKPQRSSRAIAKSTDGGLTWSASKLDPVLIEPTCQASIRRFSWLEQGKSRILFSNPASQKARENLTIRLSYDECETWPVGRTLHVGPSAYSSLAVRKDGTVLCLFENGEKNAYEQITLARFDLNWLTDGADTTAKGD
jgi:sialidase-1